MYIIFLQPEIEEKIALSLFNGTVCKKKYLTMKNGVRLRLDFQVEHINLNLLRFKNTMMAKKDFKHLALI